MSLGTEGAAAAADTACAVLQMLAQNPSLVDRRAASATLQQASAVIRHAVASLGSQNLASALCVLSSLCLCVPCVDLRLVVPAWLLQHRLFLPERN